MKICGCYSFLLLFIAMMDYGGLKWLNSIMEAIFNEYDKRAEFRRNKTDTA